MPLHGRAQLSLRQTFMAKGGEASIPWSRRPMTLGKGVRLSANLSSLAGDRGCYAQETSAEILPPNDRQNRPPAIAVAAPTCCGLKQARGPREAASFQDCHET